MEAHMELDDTISRVKTLIAQREQIDAELATIFGGTAPPPRKQITCGKCGEIGHTARSCTKQEEAT
jgi:hypothetical protein